MKENKSVIEIIGLVIIYIGNFMILGTVIPYFSAGYGGTFETIVFLVSISSTLLTLLYNFKAIKNRLLVGILGIPVSVIGGILVLVSIYTNPKPLEPISKGPKFDSKEASAKLINLKRLLDEGIISQETYNEKSKLYIEQL